LKLARIAEWMEIDAGEGIEAALLNLSGNQKSIGTRTVF